MVEVEHQKSNWKIQKSGIRQGCTLSPYLFILTMTAILHDVKTKEELNAELIDNRPPNFDFDEMKIKKSASR